MDSTNAHPQIGVGVIVIRDNKVLMQKRLSKHGHGTWAFPGGHLEFGESPEQCAIRETKEEAGINITNLRRGPYTNDLHASEQKHVITLFIITDSFTGEPTVCEPEKNEGWEWFEWNDMPEPLFLAIVHLREQGFNPFKK